MTLVIQSALACSRHCCDCGAAIFP